MLSVTRNGLNRGNELLISGVNFIKVPWAAFTHADPIGAKKLLDMTVFFALLRPANVKAAHGTLVKLTPGHLLLFVTSLFLGEQFIYKVNFINRQNNLNLSKCMIYMIVYSTLILAIPRNYVYPENGDTINYLARILIPRIKLNTATNWSNL